MAGFGRMQAALYDVVNRGAARGLSGRERPRLLPGAAFSVTEQAVLEPTRTGPFESFRVGVAT